MDDIWGGRGQHDMEEKEKRLAEREKRFGKRKIDLFAASCRP
jgi:hypothetical protein